jgi:hypothetical protein
VASSLLLLLVSCSREEIKTPSDANFEAKYETYYRIVTFIEQMQGKELSYPVLTPRSDFSPTETRDYIEGAMNLQYTDPELTWEDYDEATDTFTVLLTSGVATEVTVSALFEEVTDSASVHFYRIAEQDKFPYLYDATIISSGTSSMQLAVTSIVGLIHRDPTPFGELDYWSVFKEGLCDPNDQSTLSASDLQNDALNDWFTPYGCGVWTSIENIGTDELKPYGWEADNPTETAGDWIMDFRTFVVECNASTNECSILQDSGAFCLAPVEMNYYFQSIVDIYDDFGYAEDLSLRMSTFGLLSQTNGDYIRHFWSGSNRWGIRSDCIEGPYPYALPQCC